MPDAGGGGSLKVTACFRLMYSLREPSRAMIEPYVNVDYDRNMALVVLIATASALAAPNTHFVALMQTILFRGAGMEAAWPQFVALAVIGTLLFGVSLTRFRRTLGSMA